MTLASDRGGDGPLWAEFTRAQNGQAVDNLARAFHLPRPKTRAALAEMLAALTPLIDEQTLSRATLARLVDLMGKNNYELVLEDATLMGATSTQVIGTEALTALVGHGRTARMAGEAAAAADISQMIAEYLFPVVAAMFLGALSVRTRGALTSLARYEKVAANAVSATDAGHAPQLLPVGRGSSGVFSGATVITPDAGPGRDELYRDLANRIRSGGDNDPLGATRRVMAEAIGVRARHAPWLTRMHRWTSALAQSAGAQIQQRLRRPRDR